MRTLPFNRKEATLGCFALFLIREKLNHFRMLRTARQRVSRGLYFENRGNFVQKGIKPNCANYVSQNERNNHH